MDFFLNKAGDHADTDAILKAAGIFNMLEHDNIAPDSVLVEHFRERSGEVKTSVKGLLHGWVFERAWYYWRATGPGIELEAAMALHATHGNVVRVDGHCGCPSPLERYEGLACGSYHVDTPEGLKALADTIRSLVVKAGGTPKHA